MTDPMDDLRQASAEVSGVEVLSPAAQAVVNASIELDYGRPTPVLYRRLAAALRVAADQVLSSVSPPCEDFDEYAQGFLSAHVKYRGELLAIAAELDGASG